MTGQKPFNVSLRVTPDQLSVFHGELKTGEFDRPVVTDQALFLKKPPRFQDAVQVGNNRLDFILRQSTVPRFQKCTQFCTGFAANRLAV